MLRAVVHVGLSALLVIAPALCCCNVRLLAGAAVASPVQTPASAPAPQPAPLPSCCHTEKPVPKPAKKASCCHDAGPASADTKSVPQPAPKPAKPSRCDCCGERPAATPPEGAPSVAAPEPTGELVPLALVGLADISPEHLGLSGGLEPSGRTGVDTRSAALFERHVLRC
jgi:hypothetical protein